MIYFAHRGANTLAPANSTLAFALAKKQGAVYYELDVHLSQDKQLIVHHDYTLSTDTTCVLNIKEVTWAEVQHSRYLSASAAAPHAHPPLLAEVMDIVLSGATLVNIEIKNDDNMYPGIEQVLWNYVKPLGEQAWNKLLISSFDLPTLERFHAIAPQLKIGILTRAFDPGQACSLQAYSVHINHSRVTADIIQTCHAQGRKIFVYTVNEVQLAQQLAAQGVDGIFTDRLDLFADN